MSHMILNFCWLLPASLLLVVIFPVRAGGQESVAVDPNSGKVKNQDGATVEEKPVVYVTDFENETDDWELIDDGWKIQPGDHSQVFSQFRKESNYIPKFRSPFHQAILRDRIVGDFQLDVRVLSTHVDYNHRDACVFFGYQSPTEFYYLHLGKVTDQHANQIFIVNNADRSKISLTTTEGTPWDDQWHQVRIIRKIDSDEIQVFFDDLEKPAMTAVDKTFVSGRIGLGSFDDTADWDDFKLSGVVVEAAKTVHGS